MLIMIPVELREALREAVRRRPKGQRFMRSAILEAIEQWLERDSVGKYHVEAARDALLHSTLFRK